MAHPVTRAKTIADLGEFGLIDRIAALTPQNAGGLVLGIGDDAAAFRPTPGLLQLATCDIQVEGRHFRRQQTTACQLGRRSAAVNMSDIAAMGGTPRFALVSLALPQDLEVAWIEELYRGLNEEFGRYGATIAGGNLSASRQEVVIDIALLGEVAEREMLRRHGARPGESILVTGSLGDSALGRQALDRPLDLSDADVATVVAAHRTPTPRVREGRVIAQSGRATAMIDVSDGLAGDLRHICERSGVGARIFAARVPLSPAATRVAAALGAGPLEAALHGGEDYQLLFTCAQAYATALTRAVQEATGTPATVIGEITKGHEMTLVLSDGSERPLEPLGWDHFSRSLGQDLSKAG